ncbi:MAG: hypothetical protein LBL18_05010, partial [Bacteroidales bacterium]|nr:hypothetical protein [Bacteroidales bacterium]
MFYKIFRKSLSVLLVLTTMYLTIVTPLVSAQSAIAPQTQTEKWNRASNILSFPKNQTVPKHLGEAASKPNQPDIGKPAAKSSAGFGDLIKGFFAEKTSLASKGKNTQSAIYEDIKKSGAEIKSGSNSITIKPTEGRFDISAFTDKAVRYTDVFKYIDYQYVSENGKLDTSIKYLAAADKNSFSFNLNNSKGLTFKAENGGYVAYKGKTPVFTISAPMAKDIGGAKTEASFTMNNGKLTVYITDEWLKSLNRAYPVSVDFSVEEYSPEEKTVIEKTPALAEPKPPAPLPGVGLVEQKYENGNFIYTLQIEDGLEASLQNQGYSLADIPVKLTWEINEDSYDDDEKGEGEEVVKD